MSEGKIYKVGVYIRLSREDGDDRESESVENQRDIINKFINDNEDLECVEEYVDDRIHSELILIDLVLKD